MRAEEFLKTLEHAPVATIGALTDDAPFVVVAPHPDDETLGCAGLMSEACASGVGIRLVVVTDGTASHRGSRAYPPARLAALRQQESVAAARVCGVPDRSVVFLGLRDCDVPQRGEAFEAAVEALAAAVDEAGAKSMFVTWRCDPHCDHEAVHDIARAAAARRAVALWAYPIWGWTLPLDRPVPAAAGLRLDVTRWRDRKAAALACHRSQTTRLIDDDPNGFVLTPEALARFRGPFEYFIEASP